MFSLVTGLYSEYFAPQQLNLLIVGAQGSGKTALLERLKVTDFHSNSRTKITTTDQRRRQRVRHNHSNQSSDEAYPSGDGSTRRLLKSQYVFFSSNGSQQQPINDANGGMDTTANGTDVSHKIQDVDDDDDDATITMRGDGNNNNDDTECDDDDDDYNGDISGDDDELQSLQHVVDETSLRRNSSKKRPVLRGRAGLLSSLSGHKSSSNNASNTTTIASSMSSAGVNVSGTNSTLTTKGDDSALNNGGTMTTTSSSTAPSRPWYANFCPAPRKYKKHDDNDDSNDEEDYIDTTCTDLEHVVDGEQNALLLNDDSINDISYDNNNNNNNSFGNESLVSVDFDKSMQDIDLDESIRRNSNNNTSYGTSTDLSRTTTTVTATKGIKPVGVEQHFEPMEYNKRPNAKMLPLHKIQRTIGMNLTKKLYICSAYVSVWDLGGKLSDLWDRYYSDADAVVFVWKINTYDDDDTSTTKNDGDDDDDGPPRIISPEHQRVLLEQVRTSVPDDVPFVIFGHIFDPMAFSLLEPACRENNNRSKNHRYQKIVQYCRPDRLYSASTLLVSPQPRKNCQGLFFGDASTGKGVKTAIEWIVRMAKQQQKHRRQHQHPEQQPQQGT